MDYKAIMEIMEQEQENQPMASEETQNAYSALDDAINVYAEAVQKDAFFFGYITAMKQMKEGK